MNTVVPQANKFASHVISYQAKNIVSDSQRFQLSETKKREAVQVFVILVIKGSLELFVSKFVTF